MRLVIAIMVLHGLLPGFGTVAPPSTGVPARGEPAVAAMPAPGEEHSHPEHGCGVTLHLCDCCASETILLHGTDGVREPVLLPRVVLGVERQLAHREPDRPFRPPIS